MARVQLTRPLMWAGVAYAKGDTLNGLTTDEAIGLVSRGHGVDLDGVTPPVGLSGGTLPAGVAFGPPTTIFRLRMRCTGGAATVTVVATKRSGGSDTYTFSLASGSDASEPMYADDYSSLVWTKTGSGSVTVEVI